MATTRTRTLRSNGEPEARAYAVIDVPADTPPPPAEPDRVVVADPRRVPTVTGPPKCSGPRDPDRKTPPAPKPPSVELPDARPLTKAQRVWIDPDLLERWERDEDERRRSGA
jgi:hypothetical protein